MSFFAALRLCVSFFLKMLSFDCEIYRRMKHAIALGDPLSIAPRICHNGHRGNMLCVLKVVIGRPGLITGRLRRHSSHATHQYISPLIAARPQETREHARPCRASVADQHDSKKAVEAAGPYVQRACAGAHRAHEDYSVDGQAWSFVTHDQARSKAYRWGEDGLAGYCDDQQLLCFSLGLWNGVDPILKERLFGLTGPEGNHGEDVKELYYYLDSTPTHSYMKYLYKYPQAMFPYEKLVETNAGRSQTDPEYEIVDTGAVQ